MQQKQFISLGCEGLVLFTFLLVIGNCTDHNEHNIYLATIKPDFNVVYVYVHFDCTYVWYITGSWKIFPYYYYLLKKLFLTTVRS